jgi:ADP-ribosyl-[dinitrogen reductase] hydrolase
MCLIHHKANPTANIFILTNYASFAFRQSDRKQSMATEPLRVDSILLPSGGRIGMTLCPGKIGPGRVHPWQRKLDDDIESIVQWGASRVVTLMEKGELVSFGVGDLGTRIRERLGNHGWHHLPIIDGSVPSAKAEELWEPIADDLHSCLGAGKRICIHCLGGLGRTGVIACRMLVELGFSPDEALGRVRQSRPGAVETKEQLDYVIKLPELPAVQKRISN